MIYNKLPIIPAFRKRRVAGLSDIRDYPLDYIEKE
jgi:hypothetical protein